MEGSNLAYLIIELTGAQSPIKRAATEDPRIGRRSLEPDMTWPSHKSGQIRSRSRH